MQIPLLKNILFCVSSNRSSSQHNNNLLHPRYAEYTYKKQETKSTVDWSDSAIYGEHIWIDTNASGDSCYVGESECSKAGVRKKCSACRIIAHASCIAKLDQMIFSCKPTFCEGSHRNYRENTITPHHWVHRKRQEGKCTKCGKSFQQRFSFQSKEIIAISCSWCKLAYHNKVTCFPMSCIEEQCSLGNHHRLIIPPTWIIKLPKKGYFKSSVSRKKKPSMKRRDSNNNRSNPNKSNDSLHHPHHPHHSHHPHHPHHPHHHPHHPHHHHHHPHHHHHHYKSFIIKPLPYPNSLPLLVFVNPKSGGNQGLKLLHKLHWNLNPRQVFDLSSVKPIAAIELYQKVSNLRILVCGGDGTVGWVLSAIDHLSLPIHPPIGIIPLGTGNDMARTLNWGGGYTDDPVSKILYNVEEATIVQVDRWTIKAEPLTLPRTTSSNTFPPFSTKQPTTTTQSTTTQTLTTTTSTNSSTPTTLATASTSTLSSTTSTLTSTLTSALTTNDDVFNAQVPPCVEELCTSGVTSLPVSAMNNYFSIGSDAHVSLEFHESREAKPEKFNSRFRNKMFYAGVGGIDILKRTWKDLTEFISVECDGQNYDSLIRQFRFHCILFLNIQKYAAGTDPWGNASSGHFQPQRADDGLLEVVGFTAASLAGLQIGAHSGVRVAQCRKVVLKTFKNVPAQVDGEPCRLAPSIISIERRNQARMLQKAKNRNYNPTNEQDLDSSQAGKREVRLVSMHDYENLNHDKELLNASSILVTTLSTAPNCDLSNLRTLITKALSKTFPNGMIRIPGLGSSWSFLDTLTADHYFRISQVKEHQYYVSDVTSDVIIILATCIRFRLYNASLTTVDECPIDSFHFRSRVPPGGCQTKDESIGALQRNDSVEFDIRQIVNQSNVNCDNASVGFKNEALKFEKDYAKSVFLLACKSGDLNVIQNLKGVVDFSLTDSITGMSGLHYACIHGHCGVLELLLKEVAPDVLNAVDNLKGQTALHKASLSANARMSVSLVVAGCKSTVKDMEGFLPSMLALQSNDVELSEFLQKVEKLDMRDDGLVVHSGAGGDDVDDDDDSDFEDSII